jgi:carboxypeptidase Q
MSESGKRSMRKSVSTGVAFVAMMAAHSPAASAAEPIDADVVAAIIADARERSEAAELFHTLTDELGPRLSGSPAYDRAAEWAFERFKAWGLSNAHLEPFEFGRGWTLDALTVEMIAPRYMPLLGYAAAWSPPTNGVLTGTPVYVGDSTAEEIEALGDRLRNAIVLTARPQVEFLSEDRPQPAGEVESVQTGNPPFPTPSSATPQAELTAQLDALGAGVALRPSSTQHGTVRVQGNPNTSPDGTPSIVLAAEQYNLLVRMVQAGLPVELRIAVGARYDEESLDSYNVFAEIPGSDPRLRDEIVLIGAHLDSWHTASGATDNADGVATVMETMRILAALDAAPRRTIRAALWGGEEQGLLGARAWVERHLADEAERARIAVYLNDDPGTGETYGFYMEQSGAAKEIFDAWLEPLRALGVRRNVIEGIGSTDHVPFVQLGVPAFTAIKEFRHYDVRTRHTNVDFADAVDVEDLRQSAIVMAVVAWHAATRDEPIPRLPAAAASEQ